jgi:predicted nucleic acid-binding Zn ribbon protein
MYKKKLEEIHTRDDISMKQAVEKWLEVFKLRKKFDESSIVSAWPEIMGPSIANRTQQIYIKDKKLFVKVESAVIKNELALMRRQIIGRVNEHVGQVIIEELIIL